MITYGKKATISSKPAKDNASAWDSFKAKAKLASAQPTTIPDHQLDSSERDDESTLTPRASKTNASKNLKRSTADILHFKMDDVDQKDGLKAAKPKKRQIQPKTRKEFIKEQQISEKDKAFPIADEFGESKDTELKYPDLQQIDAEFQDVLQSPIQIIEEHDQWDTNEEKIEENASRSDSQSSQSSLFDLCFGSPLKCSKKQKRERIVGRMGKLQSSPIKDKVSPKVVLSRKLPPQYEFRHTEDQSSPMKKSESESPSKKEKEKEKLLLSRSANTITYGRQEGFLAVDILASKKAVANDSSKDDSPFIEPQPTAPGINELMQTLSADNAVPIDEGLESSDDDAPKVQGSHALRAAGNSKRVLDELNYLFEGVLSNEVGIKRSSCLELLRKLKQENILNAIRIHGKVRDIFQGLKDCNDNIVRTSLCFILCVIGADMKNLESIINQDMVNWLFITIEKISKDDILVQLPKKKYEKLLVKDLNDLIESFPVFHDVKSTILPLISLVGSILQHTTSLELRDYIKPDVIAYLKKNSLDKWSPISTSCLIILERFTGNLENQKILNNDLKFIDDMVKILFSEMKLLHGDASNISKSPVQYLLRLLINLAGPTQNCPQIFQIIKRNEFLGFLIQMDAVILNIEEEAEKWIDIHSLMLVLLINLLGKDESKIDLVVNYELSGKNGAQLVAELYDSIFVQASEARFATNKFRCSYMAVLLAILVKNNPKARKDMIQYLAGSSFESVLLTLKEFLNLHQAVQDSEGKRDDIVLLLENLVQSLTEFL